MKKILLISLIISSFNLPVFSEDLSSDQTVLYNQLMNQFQNTSSSDLDKTTSDPDLSVLMEVMKMVQNKNQKDAVITLEKLLKNPKGKNLTPQAKIMIQNLIDVMKAMESQLEISK